MGVVMAKPPLTDILPDLSEPSNELVFLIGFATSILAGVIALTTDTDPQTVVVALGPVVSALIGRQFAYGPRTVEKIKRGGD